MELLGITIFCDDIRFEHNGKITLVGCYGPEMLISDPLPVVLPRLGMLVQLRMPAGSSSPSQILVYMPDSKDDQPAVVSEIGPPNADNIERSKQPPGSDIVPLLATNVPILLGPLLISSEGLIKVRVKCEDKIIKCGTLKIRCVKNDVSTS